MILLGFIAPIFITFFNKKSIPEIHIIAKSFISGLFFPAIGYSLNTLPLSFLTQREAFLFLNSILLFSFIVVCFYTYAEYKNKSIYKKIARYFLMGFAVHSFLGYFFWFERLNIFWPINDNDLSFSLVDYFFLKNQIKEESVYLGYIIFNLVSFYFYGKFLIIRLLNNHGSGIDINRVAMFLKLQRYLFMIFLAIFFVFYVMKILTVHNFILLFSPLCLAVTIYCFYINCRINFINVL